MISRRPLSSPGRVEKYPPPLMRFLRSSSNGGGGNRSRSIGRSRSSPLFVRRIKSSSAAAAAASSQEPSSPKVTCMGQVRVRRSKPQTRPGSHDNRTPRCKWIQDALFRRPFTGKIKTWPLSHIWPKWVSLSFPNFRRKSKQTENYPENETGSRVDMDSVRENVRESQDGKDEWGNYRKHGRILISPASTPPRNALLLTRSRSAPYRSSSLAFRFWESDNERETDEPNNREGGGGGSISRNSGQMTGPGNITAGNITAGNITAGKIEGFGESERSIDNEAKCEKEEEEEEDTLMKVGSVRTAVLGRSKSGPARR